MKRLRMALLAFRMASKAIISIEKERTMSFDLPAGLERDLERYAQAENITPTEAVVKFVKSGLKSSKRKTSGYEVTEADLETLRRNVPIFAFLEKLPDHAIDSIEAANKQARAERFIPRG